MHTPATEQVSNPVATETPLAAKAGSRCAHSVAKAIVGRSETTERMHSSGPFGQSTADVRRRFA
jgi:hypothetical protein